MVFVSVHGTLSEGNGNAATPGTAAVPTSTLTSDLFRLPDKHSSRIWQANLTCLAPPGSLNLSGTQKSAARRDWARDGAADYQYGRGRTGRLWHALGHPGNGMTHFSLFAD